MCSCPFLYFWKEEITALVRVLHSEIPSGRPDTTAQLKCASTLDMLVS